MTQSRGMNLMFLILILRYQLTVKYSYILNFVNPSNSSKSDHNLATKCLTVMSFDTHGNIFNAQRGSVEK